MSNSNGYNTLTKSMNGIITLSDGSGTVIEDDSITTDTMNVSTLNVGDLNSQNIVAPNPSNVSNIFSTNTNNINIGNTSSNVNIGSSATAITLGGSGTVTTILKTCANPNEVANKAYVDSQTAGSVSLSGINTWTALNTFTWPYVKLKGIDNISSTVMEIFPSLSNASGYLVLGSTSWASLTLNYLGSTLQSVGSLIVKSYGLLDMASGTSSYFKLTGGSGASTITSTGSIESTANTSNTITATSATNVGINNALTTTTGLLRCRSTTQTDLTSSGSIIVDAPTISIGKPTGTTEILGDITINDFSGSTNTQIRGAVVSLLATTYYLQLSSIGDIIFTGGTTKPNIKFDLNTATTASINFYTNSTSDLTKTGSIVMTGGSTNTGDIAVTAGNLTMNGNLGFTGSLKGTGSNGSLILFNGDSTSNTALTTITGFNPSTAPCGSVMVIQYSKVANTTYTLSGTVRDGFYFYLVNQGQGTCTVLYSQASLFGSGLTRGGATSCTIASGGARYFRCCEFPSSTLNGGFTNGWFTTLL